MVTIVSAHYGHARHSGEGRTIAPIPGTKRRSYPEENVKAADVKLTPDDLKRIDEFAPKGIAAGDRYPASMMAAVNR